MIERNFYCPLTIQTDDEESCDFVDCRRELAETCFDEIKARVAKEMSYCRTESGMMEYFHDSASISEKVKSAVWDVEFHRGEMLGVIKLTQTEELTPEETEELRSWILGQNSDGFGEGLEQRPIKTEIGSLYVSFWHSGEDYYLLTGKELDEQQDRSRSYDFRQNLE
ncbi:MAG: hypothetical protein ACYC5K_09270 [Saccharofermentanales bacterium]